MNKFEIGEIVKIPIYEIGKAIIVGMQVYTNQSWVPDVDEIDIENGLHDYIILYLEDDSLQEDTFAETFIEKWDDINEEL